MTAIINPPHFDPWEKWILKYQKHFVSSSTNLLVTSRRRHCQSKCGSFSNLRFLVFVGFCALQITVHTLTVQLETEVFLTVQFEVHSNLHFPCSVSIPFTGWTVFCSEKIVNKGDVNRFCWPKYTHKGEREHYRSRKTSSQTGRLRKRLLKLDG